MLFIRILVVIVTTLLITGCTGNLERKIERSQDSISELQFNQQSIHSDLKRMHEETEKELSLTRIRLNELEQKINSLNINVNSIKLKTDQFEVQRSSDSLLFIPSQ